MFCTLENVRIAGLRTVVPANEIRLEDEAEYYGGSTKKIARLKATLGMDRRRVCPPDVTASDLCTHAAKDLLKAFPGSPKNIDALIFLSQWPDWHQPATACELQYRLGLPTSCAAFDVNQGCAGYVYGLWIGASLVAAGAARQVLLLVGDTPSKLLDQRNRIVAPVFGDAGSATLLVRDDAASPLHFGLGTDGSGFEDIIIPAGKARIPFVRDHDQNRELVEDITDTSGTPWQMTDLYMDGGAVFNFTMDVVPSHIMAAMTYSKSSPKDFDWLILHQANKQIVANIADKTGFTLEKIPSAAFGKFGNCAAASIPTVLADNFGNTVTPGHLLLCGYGIGLAWASCEAIIESWDCKPVLDFVADPQRPTRQERIRHWQQKMKGESVA